jgi:hypothetical protein
MNNITVLFPGGFKPITGAHMQLAERYADNPTVSQVIILIGPKEREGITREDSVKIFNILNQSSKIKIQPTEFNSPIMAAYEYLFELPADTVGAYALAASDKDDDYVRVKQFTPNVDKYKEVGDKKGRTIPRGVDAIELMVDIDPLKTAGGAPVSATATRAAIGNFAEFRKNYPQYDDSTVQEVHNVLTAAADPMLTKEWWISQLASDLDAVVEGYMDTKTANKHRNKTAKLRKFLDQNTGKEFVYDFDEFEKTILGVKLTESVLQENYITRQELAEIEAAADSFFKKYGIDVNFQGKFTHFFDRINDPRNDSPIYMDELEDVFRELATEYGDKIQRQYKLDRPTAVSTDISTNIHMPFQLEWNPRTKMIELIPRTIKKQRSAWKSNNPDDIIYKIQTESVLTEGGLAGHMDHPYDAYGLTFNDIKEIISRALEGRLDIEQAVTEKTDGQNIFVTWKDDQIGFARNKTERVNPLSVTELQAKFGGRGAISDAFGETANDLAAAFSKINPAKLNEIFKNGRVFANMEIIFPATRNVISYETAVLQFHNLVEYDETGEPIMTDMPGGAMLQRIIEDANAHLQNTFQIIPPRQLKLGRIDNFEDYQDALHKEVDQLKNRYGLQETDLVSEYHKAWWRDVVQSKAAELGYNIPIDILDILVYRWAFSEKSTNLTALKKQIDNPEFLNWVIEFDKKDFKQYVKQNLEPFESIFLKLGAMVLKNAQDFLAVNPSKAVQDIRRDLADSIRALRQTNDPKQLELLRTQLARIQRLGGFDSIVPLEGIVFVYRGNTYKLTGSFAPINQLLGILKYSR